MCYRNAMRTDMRLGDGLKPARVAKAARKISKTFTLLPRHLEGLRELSGQLNISESALARWALDKLLKTAPGELRGITE